MTGCHRPIPGSRIIVAASCLAAVALSGCVLPGGGDPSELQAYFTFTPSQPMINRVVSFTAFADESFGITSWHWDFGDSETRPVVPEDAPDWLLPCPITGGDATVQHTVQNPQYWYCFPGEYTVTLTISNATGGEVTRSKTITVLNDGYGATTWEDSWSPENTGSEVPQDENGNPLNQSSGPNSTIEIEAKFHYSDHCSELQFTDQSYSDEPITKWHWDFGDGNTSDEQNPSHAYLNAGQSEHGLTEAKVTFTITSSSGKSDTKTELIPLQPCF